MRGGARSEILHVVTANGLACSLVCIAKPVASQIVHCRVAGSDQQPVLLQAQGGPQYGSLGPSADRMGTFHIARLTVGKQGS